MLSGAGRAVVLSVFALLLAASAASAATFRLKEDTGDFALAGNALFYMVDGERGPEIRRFDLATGEKRVVLRPGPRYFAELLGGGNVVAVELSDDLRDSNRVRKILALNASGGPAVPVAEARHSVSPQRNCGTELDMRGMSPQGEILVARLRYGCRRRGRDSYALERHGPAGVRTLIRSRELRGDETQWALNGDWLLRSTERAARVFDLERRTSRRILPRGRGSLGVAAITPRGDAFHAEFGRGRRVPHVIRLSTPRASALGGRVLFRSRVSLARRKLRGTVSSPQACGERLVEHRYVLHARREVLVVRDPPAWASRVISTRRLPRSEEESILLCDNQTLVRIREYDSPDQRVDVLPLGP